MFDPVFIFAAAAFAALFVYPEAAVSSAYDAILLCGRMIIPTLLPFFVASSMLSASGALNRLAHRLAPLCSKLFAASGHAACAFLIGISGGYPLGAAYIADEYNKEHISQDEANKLTVFCNNSGPSFIIGAVGVAVFHSVTAGVFLYCVHILAAFLGGVVLSGRKTESPESNAPNIKLSFSSAVTQSVKNSVSSVISVCGYIVSFSVLIGILTESGIFMGICGTVSRISGTQLYLSRAILCGVIELGSGIASLSGAPITPVTLSIAAFILGWGSLSVHFQSFAMLDGIEISAARYVVGRLMIALFGASLALFCGILLF